MLVKIVKFAVTSECRHDEVVSVKKTSRAWELEVAKFIGKDGGALLCAAGHPACRQSVSGAPRRLSALGRLVRRELPTDEGSDEVAVRAAPPRPTTGPHDHSCYHRRAAGVVRPAFLRGRRFSRNAGRALGGAAVVSVDSVAARTNTRFENMWSISMSSCRSEQQAPCFFFFAAGVEAQLPLSAYVREKQRSRNGANLECHSRVTTKRELFILK